MKIETPPPNCTSDDRRRDGKRGTFLRAVLALLCFAFAFALHPAFGQDDPSQIEVDGAHLRLSMTTPRPDGRVNGVLAIDLAPGWKTYWIDPGPVGLAPQIDFSESTGLTDVAVDFPSPVRFEEGGVTSAGYVSPVLLPFVARAIGNGPMEAKVRVVLGLCRELCVPVSAVLSAFPSSNLSARAQSLAARQALPEIGNREEVSAVMERGTLLVRASAEAWPGSPEMFPATNSWTFGAPLRASERSGGVWITRFSAAKSGADQQNSPRRIDLVLTSGETARSYAGVPVEPVDERPQTETSEE